MSDNACFLALKLFSLYRVETQVFKTKFSGWDDVLAVDFTRTADRVAELRQVPSVLKSENSYKILLSCHFLNFIFAIY